MIADVLGDTESRMQKAIEALRRDLGSVRTGRASPSLVERVTVDYYGTPTPINQMAGVSVPEARLLVIQPWDRGTIPAIEKAIQKSELGLNPNNDGTVIRLALPQLNEQRRQELAKQVRKRAEEAKVAARNLRRDADNELTKLEKAGTLSQDDLRRATDRVQKLTDQTIKQVDEATDRKEREVKEV
ncbi:MAG TPA: ribosome recycling factor [Thermomicrobiales bacterium]|nr:ribosome recycling factor [Thermomicrobiales bacterium]